MSLSRRWFRTNPDSSVLDRPRLLARLLIDPTELDDQIAFYERLLGVTADLRMPIPDFGGLELAAVDTLLLIASERPFTPIQLETAYSLIVPSLTDQLTLLAGTATIVLEPPEVIVPGTRARVRYPDGSLAELVEHRPQPGELPAPRHRIAVREPGRTGVHLLARRAVPPTRFGDAVRFYETVLETRAEIHIAPRFPDSASVAGLAIVGNLLLVGSDELAGKEAPRVAFALLAKSYEEVAELAGINGRLDPTATSPTVATLTSGVSTEVWNSLPLRS
jgi:hypothetical protein